MPNTRAQILEYIRSHQMASALEISRALPMTPANARHHLSALERENIIEVVGNRSAKGRGRPTKLFALTHQAMDHNIDLLVDAMLKVLKCEDDLEEQFSRLVPHLFGEIEGSAAPFAKLNKTVLRLNEMNYQARWEASPEGPRVILGHCPYAAILAENPELCQMDAVFLASQLDQKIEQVAKLERGPQGIPHCIFSVR
ncbi:MAG: helix-turn-helix domain-containing protein [Anaerolineales bacterium]|nr:helix-turn-helix domain-containing protein [Chloroflexota bacterium]MBL6980006.1 helix-turn-helix domain-containing protein [Anaerolineales bacterium]